MKLYQQSIVVFGIILPGIVAVGIFALCVIGQQRISASFVERTEQYRDFQQSRRGALAVEAAVSLERENLERWNNQLLANTAPQVDAYLTEITRQLPTREFRRTLFAGTKVKAGFGNVSAQNSSQISIGLQGTYRSIQRAFFDLETRMPQLQLYELRISPDSQQPSWHSVSAVYTAWER